MWVKIKSKKIPNTVLTVPYSAYLNSYQRKGFVLVDDKNAKNTKVEKAEVTNESQIKLDSEDIQALNELKEELVESETLQNEQEQVESEFVDDYEQKKAELVKAKEDNVEKALKSGGTLPQRTPVKKAPNSKR